MYIEREVLQKYREAGRIARRVRERVREIVREGMPVIDVCEWVEGEISKLGGRPAFPCNVSINHIAAHYTSPTNDKSIIPEKSLVKVDIGVHVDGYIADTAITLCFDPELEFLEETVRQALMKGIEITRPGLSISEFGSTIQSFIESRGLKPISNLTGHQIDRYLIHAGKSLPNVSHFSLSKMKEGEIFAIEPFVTTRDGAGRVREGPPGNIYRLVKHKSVKDPEAKRVLTYIKSSYRTLPFAERWLRKIFPGRVLDESLHKLLKSRILMAYPIFIEVKGKPVAQAEHTVLVTKDGCEVLT